MRFIDKLIAFCRKTANETLVIFMRYTNNLTVIRMQIARQSLVFCVSFFIQKDANQIYLIDY
ncbi:hypothetical protein A5883_003083 [Enterococcus sp. 5B3_DIV0040]|nr:hypothetical protein A5883_003083 [Enterococcus sp. 5B3_DIV0040]